jgi:Luciferase-like monooxygenase
MTRDRRIRFNGFKCSTVAHTTAGLWRHPNSQSHRYKELSFWIELAKTLERGKFDGLFVADALGVLDIYRGSPDQTLREGLQTPTDDPLMAVSAMAAATQHLGFGITVASLYELPYLFARKMTTLDHLTDGRIGWNIVTSALDSAARNLGRDEQIPHDERYAVTDEFIRSSTSSGRVAGRRMPSFTIAHPALTRIRRRFLPSATRAGTIRSLEFFSASRRASARPFFIRPERRPPAGLSPGATPKASSSRGSAPTLCAGWSTAFAARR